MAKSGLVTLWNKKYEVKGDDCLFPLLVRAGDVKKIELSHMIDCFFVLGLGAGIAIITLIVEMFKRRKNIDQHYHNKACIGRIINHGKIWHKMVQMYDKVTNGQLYDSWTERYKQSNIQTKPANNGRQAMPVYNNYLSYNLSRPNQPGLNSNHHRSQYWQNGLSSNGVSFNYNYRHRYMNAK